MSSLAVQIQRVRAKRAANAGVFTGRAELEADMARVRSLAKARLDSQFSIAGVKFGLDSIVGLIPGIGDTITGIIALYPIYVAKKHGLGRTLQARMTFNVMVDWLPGLVPIVGDVVDVLYKANLKNLKLLEDAVAKKLASELRESGGRPR